MDWMLLTNSLDCPFIYASAKNGRCDDEPLNDEKIKDMKPLFDTILDYIPGS